MGEKRHKILYVITKSNFGGAQRYVLDLAHEYRANHIVAVTCGTGGSLIEKLQNEHITTFPIHSFTRDLDITRDLRALGELYAIIKNYEPDIIHLNSSKAAAMGALIGRLFSRAKIIFTIHGLPQYEDRSFLVQNIIGFITWCTCVLAHTVIVITAHDEKALRIQPFMKNKVVLIRHGINVTLLEKSTARERILQLGGRDTEKEKWIHAPWIGTIAELTKNKGYTYALDAFALVAKKDPHVRYVIISDGEEKKTLMEHAHALGIEERVLFTGYIENARELYQAFDIALLTSVKEGLPYTLIEAAYASVPAVGTNVGGIPEVIEDKMTGLIAINKNASSIAECIGKLLQDPSLREQYGNTAHERAQAVFSKDVMLKRTLETYG